MRFQDAVRFFTTPPISGPKSTLAIRLMAGGVFLSEGLLKFVYVNQGVGRFTKLGMPIPGVLAPSIAVLEILGGVLLMTGLGTRLISVPFIIEMVVAVLSTKIGLYFGTSPLPMNMDALRPISRLSSAKCCEASPAKASFHLSSTQFPPGPHSSTPAVT